MAAKTLMVVGSMSSVGKSLLVTALCRIYARRGLRVAPFKAQNMSNNAAVCPDGSEIGRAQALQAMAAGVPPNVDMNPVLIKPEADSRSQIILMGRPWVTLPAIDYYARKAYLWEQVTAALDRLCAANDLVIIEGAGSPAELNLKEGDIVNMAVARYAQSAVLLVGDIDRGGIFAQLLGTLWLLEDEERALVRGLVVNKFRGDLGLFGDGVRLLEEKGGVPVLGVVPYLRRLNLPDEDAVAVEDSGSTPAPDGTADHVDLAVIAFPRIANFDDFDALKAEPEVRLRYVHRLEDLGSPCAIILPGTKSTLADLDWLRQTGLAQAVVEFVRQGGVVVGLCGGYQMLGERIEDPQHVESTQDSLPGLGLLPVTTRFIQEKATYQAQAQSQGGPGWLAGTRGMNVNGYEIHMGRTTGSCGWLLIEQRGGRTVQAPDGSASPDGRVWGCYLHGIFGNDDFRHAWLTSLGWHSEHVSRQEESFHKSLEALADSVEQALDMAALDRIVFG